MSALFPLYSQLCESLSEILADQIGKFQPKKESAESSNTGKETADKELR